MATIFLSYKKEDIALAEKFQTALTRLGHTIRLDTNTVVAGSGWRDDLMNALMSADAVVPLLSSRALTSNYVVAEVGAARAFGQTPRRTALFPVIVGDLDIPSFIADVWVTRLPTSDDKTIDLAVGDIDRAIKAHMAKAANPNIGKPRLFISHRHKHQRIVSALVDVIRAAFHVEKQDIRCTSVRPYRLPVGERTADRLRDELRSAEAVIGVITPDTKESSYVLFELGGAWANNVLTCPMLACGATTGDIPDPIRDINPLSLQDPRDCQQFLDDLQDSTTLKRIEGVASDVAEKIERLVEASRTA